SRHLEQIAVDPGTAEFLAMKFGGGVVADGSNIMCAQPPTLAGNQRGRHLAAEHDLGAKHFHLGAQGGELCELQNRVGGVLADPQDVKTWLAHKVVVQGIGRAEKCKARSDDLWVR